MKKEIVSFLVFSILLCACAEKEENPLNYEMGVYKPYKQEISPIYAMDKSGVVDGSQINLSLNSNQDPLGEPPIGAGKIIIVYMDPNQDPLRDPTIAVDSIILEKGRKAYVYGSYFFLDSPMKIYVKGDSLFIKPQNKGSAAKFSPRSRMFALVTDSEEAEHYATMKGKFSELGFILTSYNIFVKTSGDIRGTIDANYLDIDYLKGELQDNETLIYVKKDTYFKK